MELTDVIRTTFACREFTDEPVSNADILEILDVARFAPSGGNRQPWHVVVVRDDATRESLRQAAAPALRVYASQVAAGEAPWNTIDATSVDVDARWNDTDVNPMLDIFLTAPVLLAIGVDLSLVASFDRELDRVGVISGASIYPFVWNILLAANDRGLAGALTTMVSGMEADAQEALGFDSHVAVAAVVPLGVPRKRLTKLSRQPAESFVCNERWGTALAADADLG